MYRMRTDDSHRRGQVAETSKMDLKEAETAISITMSENKAAKLLQKKCSQMQQSDEITRQSNL